MEQRNQMLEQMKLSARQKRGDVQHLLGRSFSISHAPPPNIRSPSEDIQEISIPVPQISRRHTSPEPETTPKRQTSPILEEDAISIGELSVEPRIVGGDSNNLQLIDLSSPQVGNEEEEQKDKDGGVVSQGGRKRLVSESSSSSVEGESAHTPLLEMEPSSVLPVMSLPAITRYDVMFSERNPEEDIPLGGTADNLAQQP